jgi:hypothetical protein
MELKIINPDAKTLHATLGISDERSEVLGDNLQDLSDSLDFSTTPKDIIWQKIAALCDNIEEFALCLGAWEAFHSQRL